MNNVSPSKAIVREEFGAKQIETRHETATSAAVAQAQASIQARYVMAERRPRDWDDVRVRLLRDCRRTAFAARALYSLPRGKKKVEGLTVRFAEAVIRTAGNVAQETRTLWDDDEQRLIKVSVTDLESNACYERDIVISKTVERSDPGDRTVIAQRTNSADKPVYIVQCTEDELLAKEGAAVSKIFRTLSLRFLPADIIEDCAAAIRETRDAEVSADPEAARKAVADAFAAVGVQPSAVKEYLGHDLAAASPPEILHLRGLFAAIKDGEITWAEAFAEKLGARDVEVSAGAAPKPSAASVVAERIRKREAAKAAAASVAPPAPAPATPPAPPPPPAAKEPDDGEPPADYQSDADEGPPA